MPADKVYYNVNIPYDSTKGCDQCTAGVIYNTAETVLDRASDYYCSIINFSLPVSSIPIMFCDIQPYPNTDINKSIYSITLEYDGATSQQFLEFVQSDSYYSAPPEPTATNVSVQRTYYHAIYTYSKFINMLNLALSQAYTSLSIGGPSPRMVFDPSTNRFTMILPETLYNTDNVNPIKLYMNYELFQFFTGFDVDRTGHKTTNGTDFLFQVVENDNVESGLIYIHQDYSTISNWNTLRSLQLQAPGMDSSQESVPNGEKGSDGRSGNAPILASFNPIYENSPGGSVPRSQIQFSLNSAYRLIDMISSRPLTRISISIVWVDEKNNTYPLILNYRELIQVKLCFHRRDTFAG